MLPYSFNFGRFISIFLQDCGQVLVLLSVNYGTTCFGSAIGLLLVLLLVVWCSSIRFLYWSMNIRVVNRPVR